MNKKNTFANIVVILMPFIFCWIIPIFIKEYFDASKTYNPYPGRLISGVGGIVLGFLIILLITEYFVKIQDCLCGILIAFVVSLLMEINLYTMTFMYHGITGSADFIHLFLGLYLGIFIYSVRKPNTP